MEIQNSLNAGGVPLTTNMKPAHTRFEKAADDEASMGVTGSLSEAVETKESVRPEVVERGKALFAASDYPSSVVVEEVAEALLDEVKKLQE